MLRAVVALLAACVVSVAPSPRVVAADEAQRVIEYRNDTLTVKLEKVPLTEVIAEIGKQSGAEVRGDVLAPRDLTMQLDKVPLKEALERVLGEQNFTLTYAEGGKLRAIELKGGREAAPAKSKDVKYQARPGAEGETPALWKAVYGVFEDRAKVPVDGKQLQKVLGEEKAPWDLLANTAIANDDPTVRREAVRSAVKAIEADPDMRKALDSATANVSAADLAAFARATTYHRAEDLMRNIRNASSDPEIKARATEVLRELDKIPFTGPKPREGSGAAPTEG
ncbi:MAG TPA: hypothetical protein VGR62_14055 [Candidatus Binatia bacterium]|jgi:hypothetical protein|nr:hypothetical protein [Candidatus Binatia bacterium]